jgi:hypothetical protein
MLGGMTRESRRPLTDQQRAAYVAMVRMRIYLFVATNGNQVS